MFSSDSSDHDFSKSEGLKKHDDIKGGKQSI